MDAVLVNVGIGNIDSVERALHFLGVPYRSAHDAEALAGASHIILPGVGAFRAGMTALRSHGMVEPLQRIARTGTTKILGVCLGMQLLGEHSEEGDCEGLALLPFRVAALKASSRDGVKVPHVGFDAAEGYRPEGFFDSLAARSDFYFTHSYAMVEPSFQANFAFCTHGVRFVAAFDSGSICGTQFHPEKSQSNGLRLLKNYFR